MQNKVHVCTLSMLFLSLPPSVAMVAVLLVNRCVVELSAVATTSVLPPVTLVGLEGGRDG